MDSNKIAAFATEISDEYESNFQAAKNAGDYVPLAPSCGTCVYGNEKCHHIEYNKFENETRVVKFCGFWGHGFCLNGYCKKHQLSNSLNDKISLKYPDMRKETPWLWIK